jgi:hypothetical protein
MQQGWRAGGATVVAALVGLCALAGCSNSHDDAVAHPTTTSASSSTTTSTTAASSTTTSPTSAVLAGYRASWSAFEGALADANPSDPTLAATMVDPQLQGVKANLLADQQQGIVGRGPTTLHPKVTAVSATTATVVVDCAYSATELVYKATGSARPVRDPRCHAGCAAATCRRGRKGVGVGWRRAEQLCERWPHRLAARSW